MPLPRPKWAVAIRDLIFAGAMAESKRFHRRLEQEPADASIRSGMATASFIEKLNYCASFLGVSPVLTAFRGTVEALRFVPAEGLFVVASYPGSSRPFELTPSLSAV
jgi:hypothetical protein